eukprot:4531281-Prymnesium_polylepis.3
MRPAAAKGLPCSSRRVSAGIAPAVRAVASARAPRSPTWLLYRRRSVRVVKAACEVVAQLAKLSVKSSACHSAESRVA